MVTADYSRQMILTMKTVNPDKINILNLKNARNEINF